MGDEYAECQKLHSHFGGKTDVCQEFYPSLIAQLKCKICGCHRNYHRKVVYSKCRKIHDFKIPNSVDGCQKFIPIRNSNNDQCAACGCHKGFHQNDITTTTKEEVVVPTSCGGGCVVPFPVNKN